IEPKRKFIQRRRADNAGVSQRYHRLVALFTHGTRETGNRINLIVVGAVHVIRERNGPLLLIRELVVDLDGPEILVREIFSWTGNARKPVEQSANRIAQFFKQNRVPLPWQRQQ